MRVQKLQSLQQNFTQLASAELFKKHKSSVTGLQSGSKIDKSDTKHAKVF